MHLADDQGWRIQITNKGRAPGDTLDYTKLTSVSGHTAMDTQEHGYRDELGRTGFYTQQQYRSIVSYAAARHIMVVPEIDSPAHSNAMLHAFPELNSANSHPETTVYGRCRRTALVPSDTPPWTSAIPRPGRLLRTSSAKSPR